MHVLGSVFEHSVATIVVLYGIDGHRLKSAPAYAKDQRIVGLQNLFMPPVALESDLNN